VRHGSPRRRGDVIVASAIVQACFEATPIHDDHVVAEPGEPPGHGVERDLASADRPLVRAGGRKRLEGASQKPDAHSLGPSGMLP